MNTNNRRTFSTPSRIALSVLAILASAADAQAVTEWDLPGQPLANTLRDIAARTESNIIFDKKLVKGQSAPALKTRATTEEALSKVLEGTGLTYRQLDDKTVTIQLASTDPAAVTGAGSSNAERIRLAQAGTPVARPRPVPESGLPSVMLLEEIIVTGTNIRGIENSTAPITVLSREYINATGYSNTAKLLESVTQNFALANQYGAFIPGVSGNNREQGSSVNLRGIAEGTTLVLVNGRRLAPGFRSVAADISALPLSAVERVEILTDGASALYGSDAVGGVVNFILREDFEGVETRLRGGGGDGFNELRGSQAFGNAWDSGNFVASVEYFDRDSLDAVDRDFVPTNSLAGTLLPEDETMSGMFTVRQDLSGSVSVFADALYSDRSSFNRAGRVTFNETSATDNTQTVATAGVDWNFAGDWQLELLGSYANNDLDQVTTTRNGVTAANPVGVPVTADVDSEFDIQTARLKVDGTLFTWSGGNVRVALGGEFRGEEFQTSSVVRQTGATLTQLDNDQDVTSAFAEVYAPIVGEGNAITGVQALELSLAGRYEDYSTAGSSTDPQVGLMWEPVGGLRLRARYGTSFKAPNLTDYDTSTNNALTGFLRLPSGPGQLFQLGGVNVDGLSPQESESSSFGLELTPPALPGLSVSLNYYTIEYDNIIATPANNNAAVALSNPAVYQDIIINNPSVDQVNAAIAASQLGLGFTVLPIPRPDGLPFSPDLVDVLVDLRRRNLSVVKSEGVDLGTQYSFDVGDSSVFLGLNGTYILNQESQVTDTAPEVETVDTIYNPPSWRARALFGWQYRGWATNLFVNHTDSYTDNRVIVGAPANRDVDAYTTVDMRVGYDFSSRFNSGLLSGFSIALAAQNVLDEDPPSTAINSTMSNGVSVTFDTGFDPTNADPLGRVISLEFTKAW